MRKDAPVIQPDPAVVERRRLTRKRVLLSGVIADTDGKNEFDCAIRDMNTRGAQVQVQVSRTLQLGGQVYLVDTHNESAYLATVVWVKSDRTGLSFVRSYSLEVTMPPQLEFLGKLVVEAKLRQVRTLVERGIPVEDATRVVGLTEDYLERFGERGLLSERVAPLLHRARKLFAKDR